MAKTGTQSLEGQLLSARKRLQWGHVEGALFDATWRLTDLRESLKGLASSQDSELLRHFPVAAIAVLETHFKATVQAIVNSGTPYFERGISLTKDRLKSISDILPLVHRQTVTIGELIAHQLPFNSISSYEDAVGALLDVKLKNLLTTVRDTYGIRNGYDSPLLIQNISDLWKQLSETFERRHILAHEAATKYIVSWEDANTAIECVTAFTTAMDAALWATVWEKKPLTQAEINDDAWTQYSHFSKEFYLLLRHVYAIAKRCGEYELFKQQQIAWRRHAVGWARMMTDGFVGGSVRPFISAMTRKQLLEARRKELEIWVDWRQPEAYAPNITQNKSNIIANSPFT
jgi:hypothetical protein